MPSKMTGNTRIAPSKNLADILISRIREQIFDGELQLGDQLPTEQEMAEAFGVSRTVVREAIAALRSDGLVRTRQGRGVFVASNLDNRPFKIDTEMMNSAEDVMLIMELRMTIELEAAAVAAERRTKQDIAVIAEALEAVQKSIDIGEEGIEADFEFHCAIAAATKNPYFVDFLKYLGRIVIPPRYLNSAVLDADAMHDYLTRVQTEHRDIEAAIINGDSESARQATRLHLANGRERFRQQMKEKTGD